MCYTTGLCKWAAQSNKWDGHFFNYVFSPPSSGQATSEDLATADQRILETLVLTYPVLLCYGRVL